MGYTHFKGISLLEEGLAVGQKGQEKSIIDVSGNITTSGLTAVTMSTDNMAVAGSLRLDIAGTIGSSALDHYDGYITVNISGQNKKIPYLS